MQIQEATLLVKQPVAVQASWRETNTANQGIGQTNTNTQTGQCVGGNINGACNNTGLQTNANSGSNTAGQTAGGGAAGGGGTNTANQGIGQTNTNTQTAQCVGSGDINGACNNTQSSNQCKFRKQHCWSNSRWWNWRSRWN